MHNKFTIAVVSNIIKVLGISTTAFLFTQCDRTDDIEHTLHSQFTPQLTAEFSPLSRQTKSRISTSTDGKVNWDANDELKVFIVPTDNKNWTDNSFRYITDDEHCAKNIFYASTDKKPSLLPEASYDWYVMSPYDRISLNSTGSSIAFSFDGQTQDNSNPTAHLTRYDLMTAFKSKQPGNTNSSLQLIHQATLMIFDIVNATGTDISLNHITFQTDENTYIGGSFSYDFKPEGRLTPLSPSNLLILNLKQPYTLASGQTFTAYTIMPPFTLAHNKTFTVNVNTNKGNYKKSTTANGKDIHFTAGSQNRATVRIQSIEKEGAIFAKGVTKTSGWYDVNKKGDGRTEEGDAVMCWAASAANMIEWWQERYKEINGPLPSTAVSGKGKKYELAIFELYQKHWTNMSGSEVYYGIPWYFKGENRGQNTTNTAQPNPGTGGYWSEQWPAIESLLGSDYIPFVQYYPGWGPWRGNLSKSPFQIVTELIIKGINEGVISLSIQAGYSNQHAITLWGYELNDRGELHKVYITDSDDLLSTPKAPRVQLLNEYTVHSSGEEISIRNAKGTTFNITQITRFLAPPKL